MFGRNAKCEIDSLVGAAARVEGDLCFAGGMRIDGEVRGNVVGEDGPASLLVVSEHARIAGDIRCATVVVSGLIEGNVFSSEHLELQPGGRIVGDVHYRMLEMHGGALVTGKLTHEEPGEPVFHLSVAEGPAEASGGSVNRAKGL